jgi:hypothetical protein
VLLPREAGELNPPLSIGQNNRPIYSDSFWSTKRQAYAVDFRLYVTQRLEAK